MEQGDLDFIINSWLMSYRKAPANYRVRNEQYFAYQPANVQVLLERSIVTIFCDPDNPTEIMGYIVVELGHIVHYVYVKQPYRGVGIADKLMDYAVETEGEHRVILSHMTRKAWIDKWFEKLGEKLVYVPEFKYPRRAA
jgi:GNAT superfamily N-acetyltransferase